MLNAHNRKDVEDNYPEVNEKTRNNSISSESSLENSSFSHDPYRSYGFHYIEENQSQSQQPSRTLVLKNT